MRHESDVLGRWMMPLYLALFTVAAFVGIAQNGFVDWDDRSNLVDNLNYRGLGWTHLHWMLTTFHMGHYIPLTWMTFGLDYVLWGMNPVGYHLTNLLLHVANVVTFYFVATRLLEAARPSPSRDIGRTLGAVMAALLFAVHPLRVESVAWATERRDVLCGLFYLLAILFYLRVCARAVGASLYGQWRYWVSLGLFALALLSKSMAVSLPVVLLVLDVYPLRRLGGDRGWLGPAVRRVWVEKVPFALLSLCASAVALVALGKGASSIVKLGWFDRVIISLYSLAFYLWKMLLPIDLSPIYALPERIDPFNWPFLVAGLVVLLLTAAAMGLRHRWPALLAVWTSYVVILLPVLGIVQNGPQIAADRYTYLASLGWTVLAGAAVQSWWRVHDRRWVWNPAAVAAAVFGVAVIAGFGVLTWSQVDVWRDSESLWSHAIAVRPSPIALNNMGLTRQVQGRHEEALEQFRAIVAMRPGDAMAHLNLGVTLASLGRYDDAIPHLRSALELRPGYAKAHNNLGGALLHQGRMEEAIDQFRRALAIAPHDASTHNNLGYALSRQGHLNEAERQFREALRLKPDFPEARANLAQLTGKAQ